MFEEMEETRRYAKASHAGTVTPLARLLAQHDQDMTYEPSRACRRLAIAAAAAGVSLAFARGAVAAILTPTGTFAEGVFHFGAVFKTCAPLYVLPFVLVSQYDCWNAVNERKHGKRNTEDFSVHSQGRGWSDLG